MTGPILPTDWIGKIITILVFLPGLLYDLLKKIWIPVLVFIILFLIFRAIGEI